MIPAAPVQLSQVVQPSGLVQELHREPAWLRRRGYYARRGSGRG